MTELLTALSNLKKEVGKLSKTETNPFFKSKYFDINSLIEQVEPLLEKNGLLLLQPIVNGSVKSIIFHIATGHSVESEMLLPIFSDPQKTGSAITYFRRYTLQSLLGLQAEDDDGNKAAQPPKPLAKTLSDEAFEKALQSDEKGLQATIKVIKEGKFTATEFQFASLVNSLAKIQEDGTK